MARSLTNKTAREIIHLLESLKTAEEKAVCLSAILTRSEINQIGKRLQIIELLEDGLPYHKISQKLKVSSATIAAVNQSFSQTTRKIIVEKLKINRTIDQVTNRLWQKLPSWLKT